MKRRNNKDRGRLPAFVPLLKETLAAPAWRAMSHGARSLYVALKARYNSNNHNNGRLYLSTRDAAGEVGSSTEQIVRWYRELQFYGFIAMVTPPSLGVEERGKAAHWRLTECGHMHDPPTRDFLHWDGSKFHQKSRRQKLETRAGNPAQCVPGIRHSSDAEIRHSSPANCAGNPAHTRAPR